LRDDAVDPQRSRVRRSKHDHLDPAKAAAQARGEMRYVERQASAPVLLDEALAQALERAAQHSDLAYRRMPSGAVHDTLIVAERARRPRLQAAHSSRRARTEMQASQIARVEQPTHAAVKFRAPTRVRAERGSRLGPGGF
jgi:hypothetical protein